MKPGAMGHEAWGVIEALGEQVSGLHEGQRIAWLGLHGYADHEIVPAGAALPLPDALAGRPVPAEPLGCAVNIFRRARITEGQTVAIIGIGFIGAALTALTAQAGARVIAISRRRESRELARRMGAANSLPMDDHWEIMREVGRLTGDRLADVVIEAVGQQWPLDLAGALVGEGGRLVVAGYHQNGPRQVNMQMWNWKGIDVVNAHERDPEVQLRGMREGIEAAAEGRLDLDALVTHRYPLARLGDALDATRDKPRGFVKAWVAPEELMTSDMSAVAPDCRTAATGRPRLAFLGLGWIGRSRMEAVAAENVAEIATISDPCPEAMDGAARLAPNAARCDGLGALLATRPDGVVIATPSALHAEQTIAALEVGAAVFCQKPLGLTEKEARACIDAARRADRLLSVDLSYRHAAAFLALREAVKAGELGSVHALDLTFHNAYGPDKPWFRDRALSGGGCLIDLGSHLLDMATWALGARELRCVSAHLYAGGERLKGAAVASSVEDYVAATLETSEGGVIRIACSWNLAAGREAVIGVDAFGSRGGFSIQNVDGSFYDFAAYRHHGTRSERRVAPPDAWSGRAATRWAKRLAEGARFDPACENLAELAAAIDAVYARAAKQHR